jgi:two-component system response regulator HydG
MTSLPRVLIVEDKESLLRLLEKILAPGHQLTSAADGAQALRFVGEDEFDVVLSDIRMPGADGFEVLRAVKARAPRTEVVLMTAYASVPKAVEAMKLGAYDYLTKPFDPDEVALVVARAADRARRGPEEGLSGVALPVEQTPASAAAAPARPPQDGLGGETLERLVGTSAEMAEALDLVRRAAPLDITVLVQGESGTGKELIARAIHEASPRRNGRFVPVNCGALPGELVESELFGHAKGAFTGAQGAKRGLFEEATGGTIFLDEIGDLPLAVQVKLNRVLQEKELRRVGENTPIRIDARVIAATHRDLRAEVAADKFREDLFYRLNVFPLRAPPLRARKQDIPLLAEHFLRRFAAAHQRPIGAIDPEALRVLVGYGWPGNVRELENVIERAVAVARTSTLSAADLPRELREQPAGSLPATVTVQLPYRHAVELARDRASRDYLTALLREFHGNVSRAAERAGMERESLHRLLKRYSVRSDEFKRGPDDC